MRVFLSAGENPAHAKKIIGGGGKNVLLSYYYLRQKRVKVPWVFDNAPDDVKFMIDSGAHTFIENGIDGDVEDFCKRYCEDYLSWISKVSPDMKKRIVGMVELDIDSEIGTEKVYEIQRKYFEPFEKESGIPVIYVWHGERGHKGWADMCKRHTYTGFNEEVGNRDRVMNRTAAQNKTKVHGFAMTRVDMMLKSGFYSVDSTSWLAAELYGSSSIWKGNRMITLNKTDKGQKRVYKRYYEKLGLDFKKIMSEDAFEIGKANVAAWVECEKFINARTEKAQWWDKEDLDNIKTTEARPIEKPAEGNQPMTFKLRIKKKTEAETGLKNGQDNTHKEGIELDKRDYKTAHIDRSTTKGAIIGDMRGHSPNESPAIPTPIPTPNEPTEGVNIGSDNPSTTCLQTGENTKSVEGGKEMAIIPPVLDDSDRAKSLEARKTMHVETALTCNNCVYMESCPNSKKNSVCTLINTFKRMESKDQYDCAHKIREIISVLETRAWRNMYFEQLDGGVADKNNSALMGDLIEYHKMLAELYKDMLPNKDKVTIEGSDVLERIFGPAKGAIDVTPGKDAENAVIVDSEKRTEMPYTENDPTNTPPEGENETLNARNASNEVPKTSPKPSLADKLRKMMDKRGK